MITDKLEKVSEIARDNNGLISTGEIESVGISRANIVKLTDSGLLVKESRGIYSVASEMSDEYAAIQKRSGRLIFSYGTALFFHGISDRVPQKIDITVPQGYNVSRIKKDHANLRFHYVKPELLDLGAEVITSPQGSNVVAYNKERCICDIVNAYNKVDKQIFTQAIKEYFEGGYSARSLIKMARILGVEEEIRKYMEVL